MTSVDLAVAGVLSFTATFLFAAWHIRSLKGSTIVGIDIHKPNSPRIAEMGGVAVVLGFYLGVTYLAIFASSTIAAPIFNASMLAILGSGFVGILDDLFAIPQRYKAILPFLASVPLGIVIFFSRATELLGLDVGVLMIVFVPLGVTCAANASNMLEGYNGLGAGLGIIMSAGLITLAYLLGAIEGLFLLVPLTASLIAFLWYNRYPARLFPGDSMTLTVGAALACAAIISQPSFKLFGLILFIPMIVEFALKARGRFRAENFAYVESDGRLSYPGRIESLTHLLIRSRRLKEWQVVAILWGIEAAIVVALLAWAAATLPP